MCVCVRERETEREIKRESVCVRERDTEREIKRERESVCVCLCVCERENCYLICDKGRQIQQQLVCARHQYFQFISMAVNNAKKKNQKKKNQKQKKPKKQQKETENKFKLQKA